MVTGLVKLSCDEWIFGVFNIRVAKLCNESSEVQIIHWPH